MGTANRFVGIDLGTRALHVVTLQETRARMRVTDARVLTPDAKSDPAPIVAAARAVAIDAPAAPSSGCHAGDESLAPKFRTARCGEIALGRGAAIWVPWPTPTGATDAPAWMQVGFAAWAAARAHAPEPIE